MAPGLFTHQMKAPDDVKEDEYDIFHEECLLQQLYSSVGLLLDNTN